MREGSQPERPTPTRWPRAALAVILAVLVTLAGHLLWSVLRKAGDNASNMAACSLFSSAESAQLGPDGVAGKLARLL
jgi:hypothetical protein